MAPQTITPPQVEPHVVTYGMTDIKRSGNKYRAMCKCGYLGPNRGRLVDAGADADEHERAPA